LNKLGIPIPWRFIIVRRFVVEGNRVYKMAPGAFLIKKGLDHTKIDNSDKLAVQYNFSMGAELLNSYLIDCINMAGFEGFRNDLTNEIIPAGSNELESDIVNYGAIVLPVHYDVDISKLGSTFSLVGMNEFKEGSNYALPDYTEYIKKIHKNIKVDGSFRINYKPIMEDVEGSISNRLPSWGYFEKAYYLAVESDKVKNKTKYVCYDGNSPILPEVYPGCVPDIINGSYGQKNNNFKLSETIKV
jgi:hypothetical protein